MTILSPLFIIFLAITLIFLFLISHRHHLLIILLYFERAVLCLCLLTGILLKKTLIFSIMFVLTFGATEARLGLCLIVLIARSYGSDLIKCLAINKT